MSTKHISWDATRVLIERLNALETAAAEALEPALAGWNERLAHCGGEPSRQDWAKFRPLRLTREEDWSDWLAYLLERSTTHRLFRHLTGFSDQRIPSNVEREWPTLDRKRRADIVICVEGGDRIQLEIKVGDSNFSKTNNTAKRLEKSGENWLHFLLVPPSDAEIAATETETATAKSNISIGILTWRDVAVGLRASLLPEDGHGPREDVAWSVWARAFCGNIEQKLLGLSPVTDQPAHQMARIRLTILEEAERLMEKDSE